jgi:hypothetical protein
MCRPYLDLRAEKRLLPKCGMHGNELQSHMSQHRRYSHEVFFQMVLPLNSHKTLQVCKRRFDAGEFVPSKE